MAIRKPVRIAHTLRMTEDEAQLIRDAAILKRQSANYWITTHIIAIAKKELAAAAKAND